MYKIEVYREPDAFSKNQFGRVGKYSISEYERVDDIYLREKGNTIKIYFNKLKKIYMKPFIWTILDFSEKEIIEEYFQRDYMKSYVSSMRSKRAYSVNSKNVYAVRELIVPINKKVYLLGTVKKNKK